MTFIQHTTPTGKVRVTCDRCHDTDEFVRGDLRITRWKVTHKCPEPERAA